MLAKAHWSDKKEERPSPAERPPKAVAITQVKQPGESGLPPLVEALDRRGPIEDFRPVPPQGSGRRIVIQRASPAQLSKDSSALSWGLRSAAKRGCMGTALQGVRNDR